MSYRIDLSTRERRAYVFLVFLTFLMCACGCKVVRVTQAEVEEKIHRDLPLGASSNQVMVFLDSLTIGGLRAEHGSYIADVPDFPRIPPEGPAILNGGHISATIRNAARDDRQLLVYNIHMDFRFDSENRLSGYKVTTQGDW